MAIKRETITALVGRNRNRHGASRYVWGAPPSLGAIASAVPWEQVRKSKHEVHFLVEHSLMKDRKKIRECAFTCARARATVSEVPKTYPERRSDVALQRYPETRQPSTYFLRSIKVANKVPENNFVQTASPLKQLSALIQFVAVLFWKMWYFSANQVVPMLKWIIHYFRKKWMAV